ncbi:MAG: hypothetical protein EAX90_15070 [Candidatus Heimdallarchaeota archaeon]|nr:hypothetical protein [Candidatus Heimdallarchaeota archaeon]
MIQKNSAKKITSRVFILILIVITGFIQIQFTTAITNKTPLPRYGHEMVYDEKNNQTIIFGGENPSEIVSNFRETWIYSSQLQTWSKISSSESPIARIGHKMVYNSISGQIILFGGMETTDYTRLNDMWTFNPENLEWSKLTPSQSPSARSDHAMYFDPIFNVITLFGGYLSNDLHSSETWIYNFTINNWYQINPLTKPAEIYGHTFVYDSNLDVGVLFGGRYIDLMSETWFFNISSSSWMKITPSINPIKRYWFDMVYNTYEQNFIMFGGDNEQSPIRALGDTWTFSSSTLQWTSIQTSASPPPRNNHAMVFDSYMNKTLLFGGYGEDYSKVYGDFWMYDSKTLNWNQISSPSISSTWIIIIGTGGGIVLISGVIIAIVFVQKKQKKA